MWFLLLSGILCVGMIVLTKGDHRVCQSTSSKEADDVRQLRQTKQELFEVRERAFQSFTRGYA